MQNTCRFSHDAAQIICSINTPLTDVLSIAVRTEIKTPPYPSTQTISHGSQLMFTCRATTDPQERDHLAYHWLKDGEPVNLADPRITKSKDGSLKVANVNSSDTGTYTCVAANTLDSDRKSATVKVIGKSVPSVG